MSIQVFLPLVFKNHAEVRRRMWHCCVMHLLAGDADDLKQLQK